MNQDSADRSQRPLLPPEPEAEPGMLRWIAAAVAVLVLIVGAYHAYEWLVSDVAQRRATAEGTVIEPVPTSPMVQAEPPPVTPTAARTASAATPAAEAPVPAVTGGGVNKCVREGHVTYTSGPCPEGSEPTAIAAAGIDPNGVLGSTGDRVPATVAQPLVLATGADPAQLDATCRYLAAEIERLDFEFRQPLPPQVLDHISSRLVVLRAQGETGQCAPAAKPAAKPTTPAKRPARKVVEEKAGD